MIHIRMKCKLNERLRVEAEMMSYPNDKQAGEKVEGKDIGRDDFTRINKVLSMYI